MSDTNKALPVDSLTTPSRAAVTASVANGIAAQPLPQNSWAELSDRLMVAVSGAGNEKFLQGQFSQNVSEVTAEKSLHAAASNRKGRAYALVRMLRHNQDILMDFSVELAEATEAELRKYLILFRDTAMTRLDDGKLIGIFGAGLAQVLAGEQAAAVNNLQQPGDTLAIGQGHLIFLEQAGGGPARYELWLPDGTLPAALSANIQCTLATWQAGQVAAGVPWLNSVTAGAYVPQMLNWQHLNGIHFKKGCYTGQEVIARMHFLGQLKKSLYRLRVSAVIAPTIGEIVTNGRRNIGEVVNIVQTGHDQFQLLAVLRHDAADGNIALANNADAKVQLCSLPYTVAEREQKKKHTDT